MPTTSFLAIQLYNEIFLWTEEIWCVSNIPVFDTLVFLLTKLCDTIAEQDAIEESERLEPVYIHIHHAFDAQGNRMRFRRIDFLYGAMEWVFRFSDTDIPETENALLVVRQALHYVEYRLDPTRTLDPVRITLLPGPTWMNGGHN